MSCGSTWHIWDLHLHTPYSVLNNQFGDPASEETWANYITQVENKAREKGITALGVTDYFTIDGYRRVLEFQAAGRLQNVLLIPNIEFRVDKVIYGRQSGSGAKRLNLHVLFSPEVSPSDIEEHFLHDLEFIHEDDAFGSTQKRKLKKSNLIEFGQMLQAHHVRFQSQQPFETGCMTAVVSANAIKEALEDSRFKGKYLLVLADENLADLPWDGQDHAVRKQLVQMCQAIFSANENTRDFGLGKKHDSSAAFLAEFKSRKPCLWGCDSHGYEERFLQPDFERYCWIKGEMTWEGLKQTLYEPEERVRIQRDNPESGKSIYTISNVTLAQTKVNDVLGIEPLSLQLNPNLVAIIGGRGSGKTALLDIVAACFQEGSKLGRLPTSFYHRVYIGEDTRRPSTNQPVATDLTFRSGDSFHKQVGAEDGWFEKADIIYLTQNHFEEYSANPDKLNGHIISLVFENSIEDRRKHDLMVEEIDELGHRVQALNLDIAHLRSEVTGQRDVAQNQFRMKEGERDDFEKRAIDIEQKQGGSNGIISSLTETLEKLRVSQRGIESVLYRLSELQTTVNGFKTEYVRDAQSINIDLGDLSLQGFRILPVSIDGLDDVAMAIARNTSVLTQANTATGTEISLAEGQVNELEGINRVIVDLRQKVSDTKSEISDIQQRIIDISTKERRVLELDQERYAIFATIMAKTIALRLFLQEMIRQFETGRDQVLGRLQFSARVQVKGDEYILGLLEKVDNRVHSEAALREQFAPIFVSLGTLLNGESASVDFSPVTSAIKGIIERLSRKRSIDESDLYNAAIQTFFGIGMKIEFNNRVLSQLSMGERAIVLLKILLALGDRPLLIDQPEEHLDNRYIYDELVPAFRSAKKRRQIVIATHNANLVVNTDAEQVVLAEHTDGILSYKPCTLEDLDFRERIKTVLEGGDEAFKKREEKYGYRF